MSSRSTTAPIWRAVAALIVVAVSLYIAVTSSARLGLDLSGGTQIVLQTRDSERVEANAESTDRALEVLRGRVDALGVSDSSLSRAGEDRIIIELPGVQDPTEAEEVIGQTAQLTIHPVLGGASAQELAAAEEARAEAERIADEQQAAEDEADAAELRGEEPTTTPSVEPSAAPADQPSNAPSDTPSDTPTDTPADGATGGTDEPADEVQPEAFDPTQVQVVEGDYPSTTGQPGLRIGPAQLDGEDISSADAVQNEIGEWTVGVDFNGPGSTKWADITRAADAQPLGSDPRRIAILLDDQVISSPEVSPEGVQLGGSTSITGSFSQEEAEELSALIEGGALPVPVETVELRTVGPTLGADAIDASIQAAIIGIVLTGLFIGIVYRLVGVMATIALATYALISYAMLVALGATLTLPGLAGFVLAIGLAIDANVLIFERAREEYERRTGEGLAPALQTGYRKAWSAIIDSNVTTLLAGGLLFFLASGPVKGFGVTLSIGVLASMVSALLVTRVLTDWLVRRSFIKNRPQLTGVTGNGTLRKRLNASNVKLMNRAGTWLVVSAAVVLIAIGGMVFRGLNLGVEFTGGRILEFSTTQPIDVDAAREAVADVGYPTAVVQESTGTNEGTENITVRTDEITTEEAASIQTAVAGLGDDVAKERDELIGPSLGEELRDKALIAFAIAVAAQLVYLAVRFRWTWASAAVIAMIHDVLAVVGIFAWLDKPIDGVFLAAVLSIIGLSVNDTIVVFDRVRERRLAEPDRLLPDVTSSALLQTLPRTINTGLGAMFILGALALLGGSSLTDFSIALLLGLSIGIYSSLFTASPIAVYLEKYFPASKAEERKANRRTDPYADVAVAGRESGEA